MPKICGQVAEIRASAGNESFTAQGSFRYQGKVIRRKNKPLLLRERELRDARLFRVRV